MRGVVFGVLMLGSQVLSLQVLSLQVLSSQVFAQECIRPEWGKCVSFPNGGNHTGVSIQREKVAIDVTPGPDICVSNEEEIGGYTFARFQRAGAPWPNPDWGVNVDDFCFYKK